jgi:hypothetical protein
MQDLNPSVKTIAGLVSAAYNVLLNNGYYIGRFLDFDDVDYYTQERWPIVLDEMDFSTLSPDSQEIGLVWRSRRNGPLRAQFSSGAVMEQTNKDVDGNPIVVKYQYPNDSDIYGDKAGKTEETGAMVDILTPERTIEITRTEWGLTYGRSPGVDISDIIWQKKWKYEKHINEETWHPIPNQMQIPIMSKHCWLCTGINATTNDSGVTYDVTYTFVFRDPIQEGTSHIGGWNAEVVFVDPATGRPPKDYILDELGNNLTKVVKQIYPEVDFSDIWTSI